jgi:hypothetical protein
MDYRIHFHRRSRGRKQVTERFFGMHPWDCTKSPQRLSATKSHNDHGRFRLAAQSLRLKVHFQSAPMTAMLMTLIAYFVAVWFLKTNTGSEWPSSFCLYIAVIIATHWATFLTVVTLDTSHTEGESFFYRSLLCVSPTRSFFVVELHVTLKPRRKYQEWCMYKNRDKI